MIVDLESLNAKLEKHGIHLPKRGNVFPVFDVLADILDSYKETIDRYKNSTDQRAEADQIISEVESRNSDLSDVQRLVNCLEKILPLAVDKTSKSRSIMIHLRDLSEAQDLIKKYGGNN